MAQLHGRVLGLPHRGRLTALAGRVGSLGAAAGVVGVLALGTAPAAAQAGPEARVADAPVTDLEALSRALATGSEAEVAEAVAALSALDASALPALEARVATLARRYPSGDAGYDALRAFGDAAGAGDMSEGRDVLPGAARVLATARTEVRVRVAERLCLLRSLERIGTQPALRLAYELLASDMKAFRWEARHLVRRVGRPMTPWLIRGASHPSPEVDLWAGWGLTSLGITDPGRAVQDQSPETLAELLVAYATVKHMGAMSVVVSYLGDDRAIVREAAREAMGRYAENGTWQLRLAYAGQLGREPRASATWRELLRELVAALDARREEPVRAEVERAVGAAGRGALPEALAIADRILVAHPVSPSVAALAAVYGRAGSAAMAESKPSDAARFLRRAASLASAPGERDAYRVAAERAEAFALAHRGIPVSVLSEAREEIAATETNAEALAGRARRTWSFRLGLLGVLLFAFPMLAALLRRGRAEALDRGLDRAAAERARRTLLATRALAVKAGSAARESAPSLDALKERLPQAPSLDALKDRLPQAPTLDSLKVRLPQAPSLDALKDRLPQAPSLASLRDSLPSLELDALKERVGAWMDRVGFAGPAPSTPSPEELLAARRAERDAAARAELASAVAALRATEPRSPASTAASDESTLVDGEPREPASASSSGVPAPVVAALPKVAPPTISLADAVLASTRPATVQTAGDPLAPTAPSAGKRHARPTRKAALPADLVLGGPAATPRKSQSGA